MLWRDGVEASEKAGRVEDGRLACGQDGFGRWFRERQGFSGDPCDGFLRKRQGDVLFAGGGQGGPGFEIAADVSPSQGIQEGSKSLSRTSPVMKKLSRR